jgi:peptide/nickel transport system substrate-binding protein
MTRRFGMRNLLMAVLAVMAVAAAQCTAPATPQPGLTPSAAPQATEKPAGLTPVAATQAPTEQKPTVQATIDTSQQVITQVVEESQAAQMKELKKGITVVSDEDVLTPRTKHGGEYHDVSTSDAVSFHPYLTTDTASSGYQAMVYSGALLRLDENTLEYIPNMAESYSISEDGLTFTFHLRKTMKWSDGQPITARDYEWTYAQVTNPANEYPYLSQLDFIKSYKALDDYTLEIKIDKIYAPALGQMSGLITPLPIHIWEKLPWSDPEKNPEINSPSVVSGPYKLVEWKRDQHAIFEANESYWYHGAPNITRQISEIVPDQDVAYQKMKSGESDTAPITPEKLKEARELPNINVYEWWPAAAVWSYIGLNMRDGLVTHDIHVRHGLDYAIDKKLLTDKVMLGLGKPLCSIYPETSWVYNPNVPCYDYDKDRAIDQFAQAGYALKDGKMVDKDGKQLTLRLIYGPNTSQTRELIAVTVQDYLRKIGIEVNIQAMEWATYLDAVHAKEPQWDMFIGAWQATIEPHIMYTIWAEENIPDLNSVAYINKDVEKLFEEAGGTYDTAFRKQKYQEIQEIIANDSPYIFLYYQKTWSGQNKRIQGITPSALGIGWNSEDWYIQEVPGQ